MKLLKYSNKRPSTFTIDNQVSMLTPSSGNQIHYNRLPDEDFDSSTNTWYPATIWHIQAYCRFIKRHWNNTCRQALGIPERTSYIHEPQEQTSQEIKYIFPYIIHNEWGFGSLNQSSVLEQPKVLASHAPYIRLQDYRQRSISAMRYSLLYIDPTKYLNVQDHDRLENYFFQPNIWKICQRSTFGGTNSYPYDPVRWFLVFSLATY